MISIFFFGLISSYDFSLGYSMSLSENQETLGQKTLLPARQDFFKFGAGVELMDWQSWVLSIRPEVLFQHALVGVQSWLELRQTQELGPKHDDFFIFYGVQVGGHLSWILKPLEVPQAAGGRGTYALGAGLILGPIFQLNDEYSLRLKASSQIFWGRVAHSGFRSPWSQDLGVLGSLSLELGFLPLPED